MLILLVSLLTTFISGNLERCNGDWYGTTCCCCWTSRNNEVKQLTRYIDRINSEIFDAECKTIIDMSKKKSDCLLLKPLFERVFYVPTSSAPVERYFFAKWLNSTSTSCQNVQQCVLEMMVFVRVIRTYKKLKTLSTVWCQSKYSLICVLQTYIIW